MARMRLGLVMPNTREDGEKNVFVITTSRCSAMASRGSYIDKEKPLFKHH